MIVFFRAICLFSGDMIQSPIYADGEPKRKVVEAGWCLNSPKGKHKQSKPTLVDRFPFFKGESPLTTNPLY
jgi:hypothetical protein